ncbi:helix-turn-helix domain-containing protein [Nostocoides veronense]
MAVPVASASSVTASRRVLEKDKDRIVQLYQSGQTSLEVAEEVGVAKSTVLRVLHERGIPIRPWGRHR